MPKETWSATSSRGEKGRALLPPQQEVIQPRETTSSSPPQNSPDRLLKARIPFLLRYYDVNNSVLDLIPALEAGQPKIAHSSVSACHLGEPVSGNLDATGTFLQESGLDEFIPIRRNIIDSNNYVTPDNTINEFPKYQNSDILSQRSRELTQELQPFAICTKSRANLKNAVDQALFSAANIRFFMHLYVQHHHKHCPIIHIPTYQAESASLPLLLATFLGGSMHSYPRDTWSLAVDCIDIAEAYMFSLPVFHADFQHNTILDAEMLKNYEVLKAVIILLQLQIGRNDPHVRRRVRYQRLPVLLHAARSISLLSTRHECRSNASEGSSWDAQLESRLRTAHWIFLLDSEFMISSRVPPITTILESTADLPCNEMKFSGNEPSSISNVPRLPSLREAIDLLMDEAWDESNNLVFGGTGVFGLFVVISGLHQVMFSAIASRTIQQISISIHRALSRWKTLWEEMISQTSNKEEMESAGFMASANEMWFVTKAILQIDPEEYFGKFDGQSLQSFSKLFPSIIEMKNQED
ncbi:hypothetical protein PENSTE_c017G04256 [Penicillium steckii]|uniref:Xylanolytic transcriptional activator regulatory domain-containing protein n=1 Tax=Penicillium steckii TaxID=303698 RepID=A0A1V6SX63_9EURO|nr:hypothetical protein PENSTE_c017G04256 [Penicillium steckii]